MGGRNEEDGQENSSDFDFDHIVSVFLCGRISADFPVGGIFKKYAGTGKQSGGVVVRGWNPALDLAAF